MITYATNLQLMVQKNNNMDNISWFFIQVSYFKPF